MERRRIRARGRASDVWRERIVPFGWPQRCGHGHPVGCGRRQNWPEARAPSPMRSAMPNTVTAQETQIWAGLLSFMILLSTLHAGRGEEPQRFLSRGHIRSMRAAGRGSECSVETGPMRTKRRRAAWRGPIRRARREIRSGRVSRRRGRGPCRPRRLEKIARLVGRSRPDRPRRR